MINVIIPEALPDPENIARPLAVRQTIEGLVNSAYRFGHDDMLYYAHVRDCIDGKVKEAWCLDSLMQGLELAMDRAGVMTKDKWERFGRPWKNYITRESRIDAGRRLMSPSTPALR